MGHPVKCALAVLVGVALNACAGQPTEPRSGASKPVTSQTKAVATKPPSPSGSIEPTPAGREVYQLAGFISPTGNVACLIDVGYARCDIIDRDWAPPPRPADCDLDYGQGISLASGEQAQFVCAGDTAFGPDEVLAYGDSITAGALRCDSVESGITCRDDQTGHGYSISREAYRLF